MNQITKTLLLTALAAGLSSQAAARDVHHRWCAEEAPVAQPVVAEPQVERINLSADALLRFNQSDAADMLPEGKATLDRLPENLVSCQAHIDGIALTGHTDRLGSEQYNYNLGLQRAQTVKNYLQGKGVQAPISVASAGESQPVTTACTGTRATAALKACLQPDRRVTVDISGTAAQ
ncbi:OmpA family protein [Kingella oralis]|uniref:OmpA family protein n=1 Tax=Kingella oralis ATCC 51147 TaxID=629741 RepID=C4GNA3_9NEIS|nr:OmpA family protein [Kingella oralis]EEP66788.1 OmpA family protein [Kingella oralis ATCC 51147]QMT42370.1 OmpA family protein [Kingella oralis]